MGAAPANGACPKPATAGCTLSPWMPSPIQPFDRVNSAGDIDWGSEVSCDGLRVVFSSNRNRGNNNPAPFDIYLAERASLTDPFGAPTRLSVSDNAQDDRDPTLSTSALELYFVSGVTAVDACIYVARRDSIGDAWGPLTRLDSLCSQDHDIGGPFLSSDGMRLYYDVGLTGNDAELRMVSRTDVTAPFAPPFTVVGAPGLRFCALDDSELTAYCEHIELPENLNKPQLWRATRPDRTSMFSAGEPIVELADSTFELGDPSLTSDGLHLVYALNTTGETNHHDLVIAERSCQ